MLLIIPGLPTHCLKDSAFPKGQRLANRPLLVASAFSLCFLRWDARTFCWVLLLRLSSSPEPFTVEAIDIQTLYWIAMTDLKERVWWVSVYECVGRARWILILGEIPNRREDNAVGGNVRQLVFTPPKGFDIDEFAPTIIRLVNRIMRCSSLSEHV